MCMSLQTRPRPTIVPPLQNSMMAGKESVSMHKGNPASRSLLVICIVVCTGILFFLHPPTIFQTQLSHSTNFPHGYLHPSLHLAKLSHASFHSGRIKDVLLHLVDPHKSGVVVVVGVSHGAEVLRFGSLGWRCFAFEPMPNFVENLRIKLSKQIPPYDVQVYQIAASDYKSEEATFQVVNKGVEEYVYADRVDNYIPDSVDISVLSVDIQGTELTALKGSTKFLPRVRSLWVEVQSCSNRTEPLLRMLNERYVLFDFVPWGRYKRQPDGNWPNKMENFMFDSERPSEIGEYSRWLCEMETRSFQWLQTDVLAIKRTLFEEEEEGARLRRGLEDLLGVGCANGQCELRNLMGN